jgi:hypothetical protein
MTSALDGAPRHVVPVGVFQIELVYNIRRNFGVNFIAPVLLKFFIIRKLRRRTR